MPILQALLLNIIIMAATAVVTAVMCVCVLHASGAPLYHGVKRAVVGSVLVLNMLQVIAQTGLSAGACLPAYLAAALGALAPLIGGGGGGTSAPGQCIDAAGAVAATASIFGAEIASQTAVFALFSILAAGELVTACHRRRTAAAGGGNGGGRGGSDSCPDRIAAGASTIGRLAGLLLPTVANIAVGDAINALTCSQVTVPSAAAAWLLAWNAGVPAGETVPTGTDAALSDGVALLLLQGKPFIVCGAAVHAPVAAGAVCVLAIVFVAVPLGLLLTLDAARVRVLGPRGGLLPRCCRGGDEPPPLPAKLPAVATATLADVAALYTNACAADAAAQAAFVRGETAATAANGGSCCGLCRSSHSTLAGVCCARAMRRARVTLCGAGRDALSPTLRPPPPPPPPGSAAARLAATAPRLFAALRTALAEPAALPRATAASVVDLALRPRTIVIDEARGRREAHALTAALATLAPALRAARVEPPAEGSLLRTVLQDDFRPSYALFVPILWLVDMLLIASAAALGVNASTAAQAGRALAVVLVCACACWALLELRPMARGASWKLALFCINFVVLGGCACLAAACTLCQRNSAAMALLAGVTLAALLAVPVGGICALAGRARTRVDYPQLPPPPRRTLRRPTATVLIGGSAAMPRALPTTARRPRSQLSLRQVALSAAVPATAGGAPAADAIAFANPAAVALVAVRSSTAEGTASPPPPPGLAIPSRGVAFATAAAASARSTQQSPARFRSSGGPRLAAAGDVAVSTTRIISPLIRAKSERGAAQQPSRNAVEAAAAAAVLPLAATAEPPPPVEALAARAASSLPRFMGDVGGTIAPAASPLSGLVQSFRHAAAFGTARGARRRSGTRSPRSAPK